MVTFNEIPTTVLSPGVQLEFDASAATPALTLQPWKHLLIGQMVTAGGDAGTATPLDPIIIRATSEARAFFGEGSILAQMAERALSTNQNVEITAVGVADAGGAVAAVHTITVPTATATAAGTLFVYIGGRRLTVAVAQSDDQDAIAASLIVAINAAADLAVTAAAGALNEVDCTVRNAGTMGNALDFRFNYLDGELLPPGVVLPTVALSTPGATDPDVSTVWPVIGDVHFNAIGVGLDDTANLNALQAEADSRFTASRAIGTVVVASGSDTLTNLVAARTSRNDRHVVWHGQEGAPNPPWEYAGALSGIVATVASADSVAPEHGQPLPGFLAPSSADEFTNSERETLLAAGGAATKASADGTVRVARLVTTYKLDAQSQPDTAFRDYQVTTGNERIRFAYVSEFSALTGYKLADSARLLAAGQRVQTPSTLRALAVAIARDLVSLGIIENFDAFADSIVVERDVADRNRVNMIIRPDLVNQLRVIAIQAQFIV